MAVVASIGVRRLALCRPCRALRRPAAGAAAAGELRVLPVRGNIFLLSGAGANIVASVGKDGVLLVDTGRAAMAEQDARRRSRPVAPRHRDARCRRSRASGVVQGCPWWSSSTFLPTTTARAAPRPIFGIINTSVDPDAHGRQRRYRRRGPQLRRPARRRIPGACDRRTRERHAAPNARPITVRRGDAERELRRRRQEAELLQRRGRRDPHPDSAHTDGDSIVQFRELRRARRRRHAST